MGNLTNDNIVDMDVVNTSDNTTEQYYPVTLVEAIVMSEDMMDGTDNNFVDFKELVLDMYRRIKKLEAEVEHLKNKDEI